MNMKTNKSSGASPVGSARSILLTAATIIICILPLAALVLPDWVLAAPLGWLPPRPTPTPEVTAPPSTALPSTALPPTAGPTLPIPTVVGPTPPSTALPSTALPPVHGASPAGALIKLLVRAESSQRAESLAWPALYTVVEWQDHQGQWHVVEGWRGTLDEIENGQGQKVWWVARADLGSGPFRWLVYESNQGRLLATSSVFNLPPVPDQAVTVEAVLK